MQLPEESARTARLQPMPLIDNQAGPRPDAFQGCFLGRRRLVRRDADVEPPCFIKFRVLADVSRRRGSREHHAMEVRAPLF